MDKDPKNDQQRERRTQLPLPDKWGAKEHDKRTAGDRKDDAENATIDALVPSIDTASKPHEKGTTTKPKTDRSATPVKDERIQSQILEVIPASEMCKIIDTKIRELMTMPEITTFLELQMEKMTAKLTTPKAPTRNAQTQTSMQGVPYVVTNVADETAMAVAHIPGVSEEPSYIN